MTPAEQIAEDTWGRLKQARDVQVRLGEETLTDLLILDFTRSMKGRTRLFQSTKSQESRRGTDLEIRIHVGGNRAAAFAVQAKKLDQAKGCYRLDAKAKSQLDILETYSQSVRAIPLYLLYNYVYVDQHKIQPYWHCCRCPDKRQLGCTLVPSWNIRQAIRVRAKNFDSIHTSCAAFPWRCLFDCRQGRDYRLLPAAYRSLSAFLGSFLPLDVDDVQNYDWVHFEPVDGGWPEWLWSRNDAKLSDEDVEKLRHEILRHEGLRHMGLRREYRALETEEAQVSDVPPEGLPRRLLLIDERPE